MASLELRNENYRVVFRYGGQKFARSLRTSDQQQAVLALARLEDNLRRLELGTLAIRDGADIPTVLLSSGASQQRPSVKRVPLLGELLDLYLGSIPDESLELGTVKMLGIHIRHLKRHLGVRTRPNSIDHEILQAFVNKRALEKGIRGRNVGAVTIKKELTTLRAAWSWATDMGLVESVLPSGKRLWFPKRDEKPAFKTWDEIVRVLERAKLDEDQAKEYWDCVYLNQSELAHLLSDIDARPTLPFVCPMIATAAYTGARRSELVRCLLSDIDFDAGRILLREKKRVRGQRSMRSVPIAPALEKILTKWLDVHPGGIHTFALSGEGLTLSQAHKYFVSALTNTKWSVLPGWHCLRHSFISNCASKGVDQRMIDDWVGHQTDSMRRRYRHLFPTEQRKALAAVFA
ncbi:MAG: site-specific integrase [Planctomycetales bacterium]|nr:site-specific integrase [Planctomycetales bacterium]